MLTYLRRRRVRPPAAPLPPELVPVPPALPPCWHRPAGHMQTAPLPPQPHPVAAAVLTTVTSHTGRTVTIHRADYDLEDALGEYTVHGYAWRCPACRQLATGYPAAGFARCLTDARHHTCQEDGRV